MKKIIPVIAALMTALLLSSCSATKVVYEPPTESGMVTGREWTVLVYMCGGNDETENGSYSNKLRDIMKVTYPDNVNVIIETGGSEDWHVKGVYSDYLQRFDAGTGTLYLADQTITANMGSYQTLADFITWGMNTYKSDRYALIIAGNGGGGMCGMCNDELFDNDGLSLNEISYAMSMAGKNFDLVALDASLMGTLETAGELAPYTDYLVAPQDIQNTDAWDYEAFLNYLCQNPSSDGGEVGRAICDAYYTKAVKNGREKYTAMSVIDMSKISTLNQAFDGMAGDMLSAADSLDAYKNLSAALEKAHVYGGATVEEGFSDIIDLGDAVHKSAEYIGQTADIMIDALNDAVVYRVCGDEQTCSTGLGFYYPLDQNSEILQNYMDMSLSSKYREFLNKICVNCEVTDSITNSPNYTASWAWATYNNDMSWLEYKTILENNTYELDVLGNMDLFKDIYINVYKLDQKSGNYVLAGKYDRLDSNWEAGIFRDNFDGSLPTICGRTMSMNKIRAYDEYVLCSVPVMLNGTQSNIRVKYYPEKNKYEIIGAWDGLDEKGHAKGGMKKIGKLDRIAPLLKIYDKEHQSLEYMVGATGFMLSGGVKESGVPDGSYIFEYELNDVYNWARRGTPVDADIAGGEVTFR